jgi:ribA/ribD-fused uncharacterized protein
MVTTNKHPESYWTIVENNLLFLKGHLSQWWTSIFVEEDGEQYLFNTAEQYMMYRKAILFMDYSTAIEILNTSSPYEQKSLGRKVVGFDNEIWIKYRQSIVEQGNYLKFSQNPELCDILLSTEDRIILECNSRDPIWSVGFDIETAKNKIQSNDTSDFGLNLLGQSLMNVRKRLQ